MADEDMESLVVAMFNIGKTLIPCMCILRFLHAHDVKNHSIGDIYLAIGLGGVFLNSI
jgi:hypothetical protein